MKIAWKILSIIFLISIFFVFSLNIFAEEINSFDSKITAHQNGSLDITETIVYDFGALNKHGIFRDIPKVAKVGDLYRVMDINIESVERDGKVESYQDNSDQGQVSLKIGKADKTITGVHTYKILYSVKNGIGSNYEGHDEIYWNITGNNWQVPILKATAGVSTDFGASFNKWACFTGLINSREKNCTLNNSGIFATTIPLNSNEGFSIVAGFPKGTFPESILQNQIRSTSQSTSVKEIDKNVVGVILFIIAAMFIFLNLILAPVLLIWYFKNKNKKRFGSVSVNFDFPKDDKGKRITPAEAGTIDNAILDQNDVIATIFDFAIRKLIRIEQIKDKKILGIFGGGDDFHLIKLKELSDGNEFENILWKRFFDGVDFVKINSLQDDFYKTFDDLADKIFDILTERKFYSKNPKIQRGLLLTGAIFSFITLNVFLGGVLILFYKKLIGRTAKGDEIDWKIDGLKLFLKNMSREHTWQAKNLITVEKYIPYAIALGYVKEFMSELKIIYPDYEPSWYAGNVAFYGISNQMFSSMNSSFTTTHASSSSSGFSGGGSSGGGGGGGGGGSW